MPMIAITTNSSIKVNALFVRDMVSELLCEKMFESVGRGCGRSYRNWMGFNWFSFEATVTLMSDVFGEAYFAGSTLGPLTTSLPFLTSLFHCTVRTYSPSGAPS